MAMWEQPKELKIPISYGHVAAKVWGKETGEPVLALHGWQDNSGSFDKLIPLLTPNLYIVAIDIPGHGFSSHKPRGAFYDFMEMVLDVRRVTSYLKWDKFSFLGHSMGGAVALMYSSIFPEDVTNIILLDIIIPDFPSRGKLPDVTRAAVEGFLNIEKKMLGKVPVYTMEEARGRLMNGLVDDITVESADVLLVRGCVPSSDGKGVVFSRDIRLKIGNLKKINHDDLKAFMRRIKCNMLILLGDRSSLHNPRVPEVSSEIYDPSEVQDFLDIYKENCRSLKVVTVKGNHYVHLNNPECIAPYINTFFSEHLGQKLSRI